MFITVRKHKAYNDTLSDRHCTPKSINLVNPIRSACDAGDIGVVGAFDYGWVVTAIKTGTENNRKVRYTLVL